MTDAWLIATLFTIVLTGVLAAGYFYQRMAERRAEPAVRVPQDVFSASRFLFLDLFRSIGENFPGARDDRNPYRSRLLAAGYGWPAALPIFYGIKCASAFFVAGILGIATILYRGDASLTPLPMFCGLGIGFLLPDRVLRSRVKARLRRLRSALPPALDLMVLDLEAGQSLDQAIADTSRGLKRTHPDMSVEMAQLFLDLRTGDRADSFRKFGARSKEAEMRKLANLLVDSDRFGASVGPALRSHAKYLRTRFRQQAQERARKVGV
ncbi:MAG TPA: type II secretion system F family protein, partial [Bryobacteraceae bacterium]|nr:type II secretion system F family protein [Bryobacteraceae bacterium]